MIEVAGTLPQRDTRPSKAIWLPILWLFIAGSRPISLWFSSHLQDSGNTYLEGSPFDRNILTVFIVAALIVLFRRQRRLAALLRTNAPLLLFVAYCTVSIVWSDYPDVAFKRWVRLLGDLSMVLVVVTDPAPAAVSAFLERTGLILLPLSIIMDVWRIATGRLYDSYMGLTTNKNMYGAIAMVLGVGALWRVVRIFRVGDRKGRFRRLFPSLCIVVMALWCLYVAHSTTSIACLLLGLIVIFMTNVWSFTQKPPVLHLGVLLLIFAAVYVSILNPDVGVLSTVGKDPTLTQRTAVWQEVILVASPTPVLGAGFESFWLGSRRRQVCSNFAWCPNEAHNGYLEVYANLGWVGIVLLTLIIVAGYRKAVRSFRMGVDTGSLALAYIVAVLVYNVSEAGFRIYSTPWLAFLLSLTATSGGEKAASQASTARSWEPPTAVDSDPQFEATGAGDGTSQARAQQSRQTKMQAQVPKDFGTYESIKWNHRSRSDC